ncbi:DUF1961 family protein [Mariniflexile ostreae]|uniref:DUF1961 family protein n=1 Tax=Mariniflexile ostreae TaxID=1520892 RepID=A0ABV5FF68_9FLAO
MKVSHIIIIILIGLYSIGAVARSKNRKLIRNIDFIESTAVLKYDWEDPAARYMILDNIYNPVTSAEFEGLKQYVLNAWLPTHNDMNYYFRKRMNSYMLEWLYKKDNDIVLVNRAIEIAERAVVYRNDNISKVDDRYTCYQISYDRSIAPVWPNYKELEIYEDGSHGLAPGASGFAGVPMITIPVRMIAENKELWNKQYKGKSYYDIAISLAKEAQKTLDYTYKVFVGADNLFRYPKTMQRSEWHGKVYIYNRVFPLMSGAIPLAEAYEKLNIDPEKVRQIDKVNQAMINYLVEDMTFKKVNGKECVSYPYSDHAQSENLGQSEDFQHGSFDSRDFQLIYKSGRYNFEERYILAMANTLVEVLDKKSGNFAERLNGAGSAKANTPISYDGYIWYASYRPEVYKIVVEHILDNNIAIKRDVYDAYCLFEILKLKDLKTQNLNLVYQNSFDNPLALDDWIMEGPGIAKIENGKLLLHSTYSKSTQEYLSQNQIKENNGMGYYDFVESQMQKDLDHNSEDYKIEENFAGGHIVFWNKNKTPDNYILEFDFQTLSEYALHMIMFDHLGIKGESVFDPKLKLRNGLAAQYTKSDLVGSRISFFAPDRKTTNLRKSPEKKILTTGFDYTIDNKNKVHHLKLIKKDNTITWQIDGKTAFIYTEHNPKDVLSGGYFAIRLMVPAAGLYDNIKIYKF